MMLTLFGRYLVWSWDFSRGMGVTLGLHGRGMGHFVGRRSGDQEGMGQEGGMGQDYAQQDGSWLDPLQY